MIPALSAQCGKLEILNYFKMFRERISQLHYYLFDFFLGMSDINLVPISDILILSKHLITDCDIEAIFRSHRISPVVKLTHYLLLLGKAIPAYLNFQYRRKITITIVTDIT